MSDSLMTSRRFAPLFWCQFFSAFNDNFLKNALVFAINAVAAAYFILHAEVRWGDAAVLGLGAIAGGWGGAAVARRLGRTAIRRAVIVIGLAMAASLAWRHP